MPEKFFKVTCAYTIIVKAHMPDEAVSKGRKENGEIIARQESAKEIKEPVRAMNLPFANGVKEG